ncbi:MAG: MFS transporter [Ignavibacterium sp.]|jgi:NNP family nitrate/nitrite transporter-like MFS transporter
MTDLTIKGTPALGLKAATLGFFIGFAAVALFGTTAVQLKEIMGISPLELSVLVAVPALTGSLLRIPFSSWVDTTGGRKPFLTLLGLSIAGMLGLTFMVVTMYPDNLGREHFPVFLILGALSGCGIASFSVGASQVVYWFPQKRQGRALAVFAGVGNLAPGIFTLILPIAVIGVGLGGAYILWAALLVAGTVLYALLGRNAWYFQYLAKGVDPAEARKLAAAMGQELFPVDGIRKSLEASAKAWQTWALVSIYFTTFGGFIALTAWLPTYWMQFHGFDVVVAGLLTAGYSIATSLVRIVGGILSDRLREGGENTGILALLITLMGAFMLTMSQEYQIAIPGIVLLSLGMGICNAAVFKLVPQFIPQAVGGATGWVGGIGALGGFLIPLALGFAVSDLGMRGYPIGFVVFIFLAIFALSMMWVLKYTHEHPADKESAIVDEF